MYISMGDHQNITNYYASEEMIVLKTSQNINGHLFKQFFFENDNSLIAFL